MNTQHAPAHIALGRELHNSAFPRLHGRWLGLARVGWVVVVVLALFLFVESILSVNALLHQICKGAATCITHGLLAAGDVRRLHELGLSRDFYATYTIGIMSLSALGYWVVAAFLFWRKSDDRVALLAAVSLALFPIVLNDGLISRLPSPWWGLSHALSVLGFFCMVLLGCVFPGGHFVPSFTRWVAGGALVYWGFDAFLPSSSSNPFSLSQVLGVLIFLGLIGGIIVVQIYRYRRVSSSDQRQQTRWVVYGMSMGVGGHLVLFISALFFPSLFSTGSLGDLIKLATSYGLLLLVPLSFGFATAHSRLWEIDVIINRTLVYGTLTVVLALVYFGVVVLLEQVFQAATGQGSALAIVGSTLGMVVLFQPFRHRIQQIIDRRFYRRTYDAAQTLTAFGARLQQRDEVDLTKLSRDLLAVVRQTMQPTHISLWLRQALPQVEPLREVLAGEVPEWQMESSSVVFAPNDPLVAYLLGVDGAVNIEQLPLDSPALHALQEASVKLAVPLLSQGELVGLLQLGPRKSDQDYSSDDRRLLHTLAIQAAPAIRVAQLVREQQAQAREREGLEQELRIARQIQQAFLPRDLPELAGWQVDTYYQPARAVGGDFYDFLAFPDGRLAIIIGDVSGKGIPAALLMTTTRTILRSVAQHEASPGQVLEQANTLLCPQMPPGMFVTCLYAILDPASGLLCYANAGHDQPYQLQYDRVSELWATGMPLGLMPGMTYEEKETCIAEGDSILWYSDGLVEAHNPEQAMFGFPRLTKFLEEQREASSLIEILLQDLTAFTGPTWEQEDDVTLLTLQRSCHLT